MKHPLNGFTAATCLILSILATSCASISATSQPSGIDIDADPTEETMQTLLGNDLQSKLKAQLSPQDYERFNFNLKSFSATTPLNSGGKYYEGRRDELGTMSGIVITPDGYFYLAYTVPSNTAGGQPQSITYVTNDGVCKEEVHDAIKVIAKLMMQSPKISFSNPRQTINTPHSCDQVYGRQDLKSPVFNRR
ncbi:MAG: hypothetical protein Q4P13_12680 [Psychrobacter sp.]|nr:hypothetical protein [Psychrobacter sp.]